MYNSSVLGAAGPFSQAKKYLTTHAATIEQSSLVNLLHSNSHAEDAAWYA